MSLPPRALPRPLPLPNTYILRDRVLLVVPTFVEVLQVVLLRLLLRLARPSFTTLLRLLRLPNLVFSST